MHGDSITRNVEIEKTTRLCSSNDTLSTNGTLPTKRKKKEKFGAPEDTREFTVTIARRLFSEVGFHKTTVSDIAREMHVSPAKVYGIFAAKMDIHLAVCTEILAEIEAGAKQIAASETTARQRLSNLLKFVAAKYSEQYLCDRNLHAFIEAAVTEDWGAIQRHNSEMIAVLKHIIAHGMETGELSPGDPNLRARFVFTACSCFFDPRHAGEKGHPHDLTIDQMISFCAAAIA